MHIQGEYNTYLFDLDNTLYRETDYLFAAYEAIAMEIERKYSIEKETIANFLKSTFLKNGREGLFDNLIARFMLKQEDLDSYLKLLRSVELPEKIKLFPAAYKMLMHLSASKKRIAIITNGNVSQQKNKIRQIDWREMKEMFDIVYANETEKKPSPVSIRQYLSSKGLNFAETVFIGDSKEDEQAAAGAGVKFIKADFDN